MNAQDVTVVVPARNAAPTIGRAVASVSGTCVREIVLVDHASSDGTADIARRSTAMPIRVVPAPAFFRLGGVRQRGLESVETPYGIWLDADDEYLEGRVERLSARLRAGADLVADAAELQDVSGARRVLPVPDFLLRPGGAVRLFERNYLPGPGVIGFRTETLLAAGYDPSQHGPEDTDILLRAIDAGARLEVEPVAGYRIHASPTSLSRDLTNQRTMYAALLARHDPARVRARYRAEGWSERVALWALYSMALYRGALDEAAQSLAELARLQDGLAPQAIAEPDGPQPFCEGWRLAFAQGTLALLQGRDADACDALQDAERLRPTAEGANNLGVALARRGDARAAAALFALALERHPGYIDASRNAQGPASGHITSHPFRVHDNRIEYLVPGARA